MRWFAALCIVTLCGGMLFWLFSSKSSPGEQPVEEIVPADNEFPVFTEVPLIIPKKEDRRTELSGVTLHLTLPEIHLVHHAELAVNATKFFQTVSADIIENFKRSIAAASTTSKAGERGDLVIGFTPLLVAPTFISMRFDYSELIPGMLRAESRTVVENYDLEQQTRVSTEELFISSSTAHSFLSTETRKRLFEQYADLSPGEFVRRVHPGTEPTVENFSNVGVTKDAIVVFFDPGTIAPQAEGTGLVSIPLDAASGQLTQKIMGAARLARENIIEAVPEDSMNAN